MQTEALDRYTFPALVNRSCIDDATAGQFRGQRCNEYGEKIGDIRIFQMVYTEVHEIRARGADADVDVDDADGDDAINDTPAPEPNSNALALAPRGLGSQISASAGAKPKTALSKERIQPVDPIENLHAGHPLQADGEEPIMTQEELVEALKGKLGGGVRTVDKHAKRPPPPKSPVKPSGASKAEAARAAKAAKGEKAAKAEADKAAKAAKAVKAAKATKAVKAAKAARAAKTTRAGAAKATPTSTSTLFSSDLRDLVHGGLKTGLSFQGT
jgi:hypothetical protein